MDTGNFLSGAADSGPTVGAREVMRLVCSYAARSCRKAGVGLSEEDFDARLCLVHSGYGSSWCVGFSEGGAYGACEPLQRADGLASVHLGAAFVRKFPPMKSDTKPDGYARVPLSDARLDGLLEEILLKMAEHGCKILVVVPNENVMSESEYRAERELVLAKVKAARRKIAAASAKYGLNSAVVEDAKAESLSLLAEMASLARASRPSRTVVVQIVPEAGSLEELAVRLAIA